MCSCLYVVSNHQAFVEQQANIAMFCTLTIAHVMDMNSHWLTLKASLYIPVYCIGQYFSCNFPEGQTKQTPCPV